MPRKQLGFSYDIGYPDYLDLYFAHDLDTYIYIMRLQA